MDTLRHGDAAASLLGLSLFDWRPIAPWLTAGAPGALAAHRGLTLTTVPTLGATILAAVLPAVLTRFTRRALRRQR